jgi:cyclophilin family peptidyl-prolyl cis-trans isomerase/HEAT repeat protein
MRASFGAALFAASLFGCAVPIRATISPKQLLEKIDEAEDNRDGASPALAYGISHHQKEIRLAALRALARTAEVGTSSSALSLLGDRDIEVATWAAFALGEIGEPAGEAALLSALRGVSPVPDQVLLALGRSATATSAREIATHLGDDKPLVRRAAAIALGLMGKRFLKTFPNDRYARRVVPLLWDRNPDVRFGAAYALMRLPSPTSAVKLISVLGDPDPEVRANAARGLGASKASPLALDSVSRDPDWRVRVERVRALGQIGQASLEDLPQTSSRLEAAVEDEFARFKKGGAIASGTSLHVLLAIVSAASDLGPGGSRILHLLEKTPWKEHLPPEVAPDLARLDCAIAFALDEEEHVIRRVRGCGGSAVLPWRRDELATKLLAHKNDDEAVDQLFGMASNQDARVRVAVAVALADIDKPSATKALVRLLESNDAYVVSAAADGLARPEKASSRPPETKEKLKVALDALVKKEDAALSVSVLDAIGGLGKDGASLVPELEALLLDPRAPIRRRAAKAKEAITEKTAPFGGATTALPYVRPRPVAQKKTIELRTLRGPITIELFGPVAPRTIGTLVELIEGRFYDDRTFHRIVSDFVAQGGCPRGDGWGGPGYTIEDETSPLPFVRGAVGIATSGRDTGGSQFFIMHAYHPHLDGNYTVVGRVVAGMEAVDALEPDDPILDVRIVATPPNGPKPGLSVR